MASLRFHVESLLIDDGGTVPGSPIHSFYFTCLHWKRDARVLQILILGSFRLDVCQIEGVTFKADLIHQISKFSYVKTMGADHVIPVRCVSQFGFDRRIDLIELPNHFSNESTVVIIYV